MRQIITACALAIAISGVAQSMLPPQQGNAPAAKPWLNPELTYGSVTDIDGNTYATIQIGTQVWMAENLRTTRYRNGATIPNVTDEEQWTNLRNGAWCHYENDPKYEVPYGKLYNWYTVTDPRKVCPAGWHLPTDAEWSTLVAYLDPFYDFEADLSPALGDAPGLQSGTAGAHMKNSGRQYWYAHNGGATNSSGFSGLPGGGHNIYYQLPFYGLGYSGSWWSAPDGGTDFAWGREVDIETGVSRNYADIEDGLSVRCLRDALSAKPPTVTRTLPSLPAWWNLFEDRTIEMLCTHELNHVIDMGYDERMDEWPTFKELDTYYAWFASPPVFEDEFDRLHSGMPDFVMPLFKFKASDRYTGLVNYTSARAGMDSRIMLGLFDHVSGRIVADVELYRADRAILNASCIAVEGDRLVILTENAVISGYDESRSYTLSNLVGERLVQHSSNPVTIHQIRPRLWDRMAAMKSGSGEEDRQQEVVQREGVATEEQIYTIVEEMPSFPGGMAELFKYLGKNIIYPEMANSAGISGVVYVTFVVDKDGTLRNVKVLRGIGGGCDEEAMRVVQNMPAWEPGKQRGKSVTVQYSMPIRFTLR